MSTERMDPTAERIRAETYDVVRAMAPIDPGEVTGELTLAERLGFDSLRLIELAIAAEQHFGLPPVDLEDAVTVSTVNDVVRLVVEQHNRAAAGQVTPR